MYSEGLNATLLAALDRPDLRVVAAGRIPRFDLRLAEPFAVDAAGAITLGPPAIGPGRFCAFHLRHALERADLLAAGIPPALATLAAARVAARFARLDAPGEPDPAAWVAPLAAPEPPDAFDALAAALGTDVPAPADVARLRAAWDVLGPAELLLACGGDARLLLDPATELNHYGCSHRPRPWAVTYASSTASSLSERGFCGAEAARRAIVHAALAGTPDPTAATAERVRDAIARHYALPPGTVVVLAASGTDCELIALAAALAAPGAAAGPLTNILTAPDETGSGVPLASVGRHFAHDTALGAAVRKGNAVAGMDRAILRADLAIRRSDGTLIPAAEVDEAAARLLDAAVAGGGRAILHLLDVSKTGLLAPSIAAVARLARRHRGRVDVVVDACQARLTAARVRSYVEVGWITMITGSKFFTGPPFCGAVLFPPAMRARFARDLPAGLALYAPRTDWPADLAGAAVLPAGSNTGLALRWSAALAEMEAFAAVPATNKRAILQRFTAEVASAIDANPDLRRIVAPPLDRPVLGDVGQGWDDIATILPFLVLAGPDRRPLDNEGARRVYLWLNADLTAALAPAGLGATERFLAALRCHIGQPAPVADGAGGIAGALRISAGARLVSGEPSHAGIDGENRVNREIRDARACLEKISLILRHLAHLDRADPQPSFGAPLEP